MKVLVTGSSGLIGSAVVTHLTTAGHYVIRLVRAHPIRERGDLLWDPVSGRIERAKLEGFDAVIHLAAETINGIWTRKKKNRLLNSRVQATEFLAETLAGLNDRPKVFLSASAIGYYGNRGDQWLNESAAPGSGFLAELCQEWEKATEIAARAGIRVVKMRIAIVLSARGGALRSMLPLFKLGLGGRLGNGKQYFSWITIDDLAAAIAFLLESKSLNGPVNLAAPDVVTNREFTKTLARVLSRPAWVPAPAFLLKLLPGRMAEETALSSVRVEPAKLLAAGFRFQYPDLEKALRHVLAR